MNRVVSNNLPSPEWALPTRRIVAIGLLVLLVPLTLFLLSGIFTQLVLAGLIAFLLEPLIRWLNNKLHLPRWAAILLTYLVLAVGIFYAIIIVPVLAIQSIAEIDLSQIATSIDQWVTDLVANLSTVTFLGVTIDFTPLVEALQSAMESTATGPDAGSALIALLEGFGTAAAGAFGVVIGAVSFVFFVLILAVYFNGGATRYLASTLYLVPVAHRPEVTELGRRVNQVWNDYIRGEVAMMAIIGVTTALVTWLIGVPGALFLGLIAGALEVIPTFGPIIATIPAVIIALVQGSTRFGMNNFLFALLVIAAYILIQQLESNLIAPKIVGGSVQLPALVVLIAITAGYQTFGILGAILAVPILSTVREGFAFLWAKVMRKAPYAEEGGEDDPSLPPSPESQPAVS